MAKIHHIRGALLEEAVLFLLSKVGYRVVRQPADSIDPTDLHRGSSGLEIEGRGSYHQIDALAEFSLSPAFMHPLRLLVEAKFYERERVGIHIVRNSVGVQKDISENFFSTNHRRAQSSPVRFNYQSAIFGVSGYTVGAVDYAIAHQIFLIEYQKIPVIEPLINTIRSLLATHFTRLGMRSISEIRRFFSDALTHRRYPLDINNYIMPDGLQILNEGIIPSISQIGGSYFGMLQGRWPLHLLTERPLPAGAFSQDIVACTIIGNREGGWRFTPSNTQPHSPQWFELQFYLPEHLAELVSRSWQDAERMVEIKRSEF